MNSTLAAETQALSRGTSELSWTVTAFNEFTTKGFSVKNWERHLQSQRLGTLVSQQSDEGLKKGLAVVDAKSLYDHLSKEGIGTASDKRTAIEMQIVRQTLAETNAGIRWVPRPMMVADCLTKKEGNTEPLFQLVREGVINLTAAKKSFSGAVK